MRLRRTPTRRLDDPTVEALLRGRPPIDRPELRPLTDALSEITALRPARAPASARLERMFDEGVHPITVPLAAAEVVSAPRHATPWRAGLATMAALITVAAGLVGAASANALPAPAQRAVAYVVEALTPLSVPTPHDGQPSVTTPTRAPLPSTATPSIGTSSAAPTRSAPPASSPRVAPTPSPRLHGPDVVVLPPPTADPEPSTDPEAEPTPSPTDQP
jgi:hypothetical protein